MRAICSNAVGLVDRLVELPCPFRAKMQRPRPSSCRLSMNPVSMLSMPADWTTPGGSNPERWCTPPISMLKACGRHFRRHAANARPIGPPRPKAPATLPIRPERRLRQSRQCVGQGRHDSLASHRFEEGRRGYRPMDSPSPPQRSQPKCPRLRYRSERASSFTPMDGRTVLVRSPDNTPLLWVIRDEFDLTGTKFGCGEIIFQVWGIK